MILCLLVFIQSFFMLMNGFQKDNMLYTLFFGVLLINTSARIRPLSVIEVLSLAYSKSSY